MGCTPSSARPAKAPKEPVPDLDEVKKAVVPKVGGEPHLTIPPFDTLLRTTTESTVLAIKQTATGGNGDTLEIALTEDASGDECRAYVLGPNKPFGGQIVRRQLEDLLVLYKFSGIDPVKDFGKPENQPLCFAVMDAARGVNAFVILRATPLREGQRVSRFKGMPPYEALYDFATVDFNYSTHVCTIRLMGEKKEEEPLYTMRQCSKTVWVLKKKNVVIVVFTQQPGLAPRFVSWQVTCAPNIDLAFPMALTGILNHFRGSLKKMMMDFM